VVALEPEELFVGLGVHGSQAAGSATTIISSLRFT
jgi:hypothetical protein